MGGLEQIAESAYRIDKTGLSSVYGSVRILTAQRALSDRKSCVSDHQPGRSLGCPVWRPYAKIFRITFIGSIQVWRWSRPW